MHASDPFGWVGSVIDGQFAVEALAGEGAFGVVYRGRHLGFDSPVAIKCLKIPADLGPEQRDDFLAKFREEARLLHRLSRRTVGIVQALDVGAAPAPNGPWTPYIVMEWLEGETLEQELKRRRVEDRGPRSMGDAMQLLGPVASALAIAHEENVSHRDVKPANLFLARTRDGDLVKVLDFGLAKVFADTPTVTEALAQTGKTFRAFTPQYGAPEQFSQRYGATGPWTDVYAMGLILVEVASGQPALVGNDVIQLFVASSDEAHRPSLRGRGVEVNAAVEAVLQRALAVNPAHRFHSLGEMWSALEAARRAKEPESGLPSARDTLRAPGFDGAARGGAHRAPSSFTPVPVRAPSSRDPGGEPRAAKAPPHAPPEAGENRVCTVLFADLSEATSLSARLAPEEVKDLVDRCFRALAEPIEALGGVVDKPVGGRVLAVFGAPRATDHDADRAVAAALGIQAAIGRIVLPRAARPGRLAVRAGITTGRVFIGGGGGAGRQELAIVGDAVDAAARLLERAPRGAVVIGRETRRLVAGRFDVEPLDEGGAPGAAPAIFRVRGKSPLGGAIAAAGPGGGAARLVGRGPEMQRLEDAVETALGARRARLVTVVGAPGVGRTRLLAELLGRLAACAEGGPAAGLPGEAVLVMDAQASPLASSTAYGLAASLVRRRFGILEADPAEIVRHKLRRGVRLLRLRAARRGAAAAPVGDALAAAVDLDSTARGVGLAPPSTAPRSSPLDEAEDVVVRVAAVLGANAAPIEPHEAVARTEATPAAKGRIVGGIFRLVAFALARGPIVIACDDVQWADDATLDLLEELAARAAGMPLCIVCATTPELFDRRPRWGEATGLTHTRVDVPPLARSHVEEMIHDRLRGAPDLDPGFEAEGAVRRPGAPNADLEIVRRLADRAEGNPRTLDEMLALLADLGALATGDAAGAIQADDIGALPLPAAVVATIQARLDRLAPDARGVLAQAAVIGRTFWEGAVERLRQLAPQGRSPTSTERMLAQLHDLDPPFSTRLDEGAASTAQILEALCVQQIVRESAPARFPGEREYVFTEASMCEVAYEMLSLKVRRRIHLLVAGWLEQRAPGDAVAALVAHHYDRGGDARAAAAAYVRAAAHAAASGDTAQALGHYTEARAIHDESAIAVDDAPRGLAWDGADRRVASWRERVRLRLDLGDLLRDGGDLDAAERAYDEARARVLRDERRFGGPPDAAEAQRWDARIEYRLALVLRARGRLGEALALARSAARLATAGGADADLEAMRALADALDPEGGAQGDSP